MTRKQKDYCGQLLAMFYMAKEMPDFWYRDDTCDTLVDQAIQTLSDMLDGNTDYDAGMLLVKDIVARGRAQEDAIVDGYNRRN